MKLRFGAGTLISLALVLAIGGYSVYQQKRVSSQPPVIERTLQGNGPRGIAPAPEFLLRHRGELALTAAQAQHISAIAALFRKDVTPSQQQLDTASAQYQKYMERVGSDARPDMQKIQQHSAEVQRLSSVVATTRHIYWQQACATLTTGQHQQVETLLPHVTLKDLQ